MKLIWNILQEYRDMKHKMHNWQEMWKGRPVIHLSNFPQNYTRISELMAKFSILLEQHNTL